MNYKPLLLILFLAPFTFSQRSENTWEDHVNSLVQSSAQTKKSATDMQGYAAANLTFLALYATTHHNPSNTKISTVALVTSLIGFIVSAAVLDTASSAILERSHKIRNHEDLTIEKAEEFERDIKLKTMLLKGTFLATAAAMSVFCINELYPIAQDIRAYAFPTAEELALKAASTKKAVEGLKLLQAEEAFRECLITSKADAEINLLGRPTACEQMAQMLEQLGAKVDQMTECFNKYFRYKK